MIWINTRNRLIIYYLYGIKLLNAIYEDCNSNTENSHLSAEVCDLKMMSYQTDIKIPMPYIENSHVWGGIYANEQ